MLKKVFRLDENGTTIGTEVLAGLTTFITMAYVMAVIPAMLSATGMDKQAVFFATCLGAGLVSIAMGLMVNFPIALAPGLGLGAYFATVAAKNGAIPWQIGLGAVFISGVIFLILTVTRIRQLLVDAIPNSLKHAITVGIGMFITLIGLKLSGLTSLQIHLGPALAEAVKNNGTAHLAFSEWDLIIGNLTNPEPVVAIIGLTLMTVLLTLRVNGAIFIGIIASTLISIPLGLVNLHHFSFSFPSWQSFNIGKFDIGGALNASLITVIFTFTFVGLMDTFGTLISTATRAGILDKDGKSPIIGKAMFVDAAGASLGAFLGIPTLTAYLESMAGIAVGGRTGLTAVTVGLLFLLALIFSPIFILIPSAATAPALIIVGVLMMSSIHDINFKDFNEGLPAFLTISLMPFTYNIANGVSAGIVFYVLLEVINKNFRKIHWLMYILVGLIIFRFIYFT